MKQTFDQWFKSVEACAQQDGWVLDKNKFRAHRFLPVWKHLYDEGLEPQVAWDTCPTEKEAEERGLTN